jgi:DNA replication protein DnaC
MASPSASSTKKRTESNEQAQPSLKSTSTKPPGTGANVVLIGPPGSGKLFILSKFSLIICLR